MLTPLDQTAVALMPPRGPAGAIGASPAFEWSGASIRFKNPDGSWGAFVNVLGPEGPVGTAQNFDTRAIAVGATISGGVNIIRLMGYNAPGDAPQATYKRVASMPAHPGRLQSTDGAWWEIVGNDLYLKQFGGMGDGSSQQTAWDNVVATLHAKGGGTLRFGGHVAINYWDNPYTGTTPPRSTPLRITGEEGMDYDGTLFAGHAGGAILEVVGTSGGGRVAKMQSLGAGTLEMDHFTLKSGPDDFLMLFLTNTTPNFHDLSLFGNPSKTGRACVQPGIRFGDITASSGVLGGVLLTNGYQGYLGALRNIGLSHLSECLQFGGSGNSIVIDNVIADYTCGSALATNGAFTIYGAGIGEFSGEFRSFAIEMTNYKYGVYLKDLGAGAGYNVFSGFYIGDSDPAYSLAAFYFEANTGVSTIIPGFVDGALTLMAGPWAHMNSEYGNRSATSYTPVFTASGGAFGTPPTISDANWRNRGGKIHGKIRASFADVSSGALDVTLPTKIGTTAVLWGQNLTTGLGLTGLCGHASNTTARIKKSGDGSYPIAAGNDIEIEFEYYPAP